MEKISWTDDVRNEEVLRKAKEEKNILQTIKGRESNKGKIEGRIELTGRRE